MPYCLAVFITSSARWQCNKIAAVSMKSAQIDAIVSADQQDVTPVVSDTNNHGQCPTRSSICNDLQCCVI
jgi:hypothetical protein